MSLDVYLKTNGLTKPNTGSGIFIRENGQTKEISREEWYEKHPGIEPITIDKEEDTDIVFEANITHNLNIMADEVDLYKPLWYPEELKITKAHQLVPLLTKGLQELVRDPERYKRFNPANGWGDYDVLVKFVERYLIACIKWPDAEISIWR